MTTITHEAVRPVRERSAPAKPTSEPTAEAPAPAAAWQAVVAEVRLDSGDQPTRYLDEVRVPCGGE